jgi:hypothetical protein
MHHSLFYSICSFLCSKFSSSFSYSSIGFSWIDELSIFLSVCLVYLPDGKSYLPKGGNLLFFFFYIWSLNFKYSFISFAIFSYFMNPFCSIILLPSAWFSRAIFSSTLFRNGWWSVGFWSKDFDSRKFIFIILN